MRFRSRSVIASLILLTLAATRDTRAGGGPECWRRGGPPALAALMAEHAEAIRLHREGKPVANWDKIASDLDTVAAQRDAWASGLYWYTDLDEAKAAAKRDGKPIVALRMLGRLDADLSCANSRFFRTTLYPAAEVSKLLRDNFVLYWSSERPVPVVTVDFGDGRTMRRTITGNSAHYMMTADRTVVDVLPGLYGAKAFAAWLDDAGELATRVAAAPVGEQTMLLKTYHTTKRDALYEQWTAELKAAGMIQPADARPVATGAAPNARFAGRLAITKAVVERPMVTLLAAADAGGADAELWGNVAQRHEKAGELDPAAVSVIRSKRPAGDVKAVIASIQRAIAIDTIRNEYALHSQVHNWFATDNPPTEFEKLNEAVYEQLFLTPRSDPWLGLAPKNAWSGLEDDGLSRVETAAAK
jgi:hypothetical protein